MQNNPPAEAQKKETNVIFLKGLSRAFAGAVIFSFSIVMTMEMWSLGFSIPPYRLIIYILLSIPLLTGLSYFVGFKETENLWDDLIDAFVGYAVGFVSSAILLYLFGLIDATMSYYEIIGKISLQAVTAAIGAMYAQSELGHVEKDADIDEEEKEDELSYWGELFLMFIGAIFLAMNPAATEEVYLIAFKMSVWQVILLALVSIVMMHAFVYTVGFKGGEERDEETSFWIVFLRFTVVGYAIALLMSFYLLWTFGSIDGMSLKEVIEITIVLGFPAALGAAASRVII
jgi:putative integral membrane protein (TIGR02587 family)